jgi:hypothetical protein
MPGEMLRETERARPAVGSKVIGDMRVPMKEADRPTLAELDLTKRDSSKAQNLANLSGAWTSGRANVFDTGERGVECRVRLNRGQNGCVRNLSVVSQTPGRGKIG